MSLFLSRIGIVGSIQPCAMTINRRTSWRKLLDASTSCSCSCSSPPPPLPPSEWPYAIYASARISDRGSTFLAHASSLPSSSQFPAFLNHITSLSALKRATHCMYAYRVIQSQAGLCELSSNDGGESGSGERLEKLLELSGAENCVVVVSRWYGGVKLGADRWKRISEVAKEALAQGQFASTNSQSKNEPKPYKKRKQQRR